MRSPPSCRLKTLEIGVRGCHDRPDLTGQGATPMDVESYLAALPPSFQSAARDLRAQLRALLPDHSECLSYAMPGFRHPDGKMTAGYAAFKHHLGLYPHSGNIIANIDCSPFKTSKSGVLFPPETPLPAALVAQIIHARLAEIRQN